MIVISTAKAAAPEVAEQLSGQVKGRSFVYVPHSTEVRAAKAAAALAGDKGALVINLDSFVMGMVFGIDFSRLIAYVYTTGIKLGRDLHDISQATGSYVRR